jgi:hypothetical protein
MWNPSAMTVTSPEPHKILQIRRRAYMTPRPCEIRITHPRQSLLVHELLIYSWMRNKSTYDFHLSVRRHSTNCTLQCRASVKPNGRRQHSISRCSVLANSTRLALWHNHVWIGAFSQHSLNRNGISVQRGNTKCSCINGFCAFCD